MPKHLRVRPVLLLAKMLRHGPPRFSDELDCSLKNGRYGIGGKPVLHRQVLKLIDNWVVKGFFFALSRDGKDR